MQRNKIVLTLLGKTSTDALCVTLCVASLLSSAILPLQAVQEPQSIPLSNPSSIPSSITTSRSVPAAADNAGRVAYVLGPDDQIAISVSDVPELSQRTQRLDPNGDIKLPMIGRVHAADMRVEQLEAELTERFKVFLQAPDVSVAVTEFHNQPPISMIGAIKSAGVQQFSGRGRRTLVEALTMAGGIQTDAGPTVRVTRRKEWGRIPLPEAKEDATGGTTTAELNVRALLDGRSPEKNIEVFPDDVISVPAADVVYVIGEVGKPGPLALNGGSTISVMEAVSSSGGALRTAAPSRSRILRRVPGQQQRVELNVDIKKMMQGKANDVALSAGDILVIPDGTGKKVTTRAIEIMVQAGLMIGTYGIVR